MEGPALKPRLLNQLNSLGLRKRGGFHQDGCLTLEAGLVQEAREEVQVSWGLVRKWRGVPPDDLNGYNEVSGEAVCWIFGGGGRNENKHFRGSTLAEWLSTHTAWVQHPALWLVPVSSFIKENDNITHSQDCYEIIHVRNLERHLACPL